MASAAFDRVAARYDELWTNTTAGRSQRDAVWRHITPLFRPGETILDLGCGTGEDAVYLMSRGVRVRSFDASEDMVRVACGRGADARVLRIEDLDSLPGSCDGALSNFGALNCVENLNALRLPLARLIRPGGYFAACVIGRFCLRETAAFLLRGKFRKAVRRWSGVSHGASLGIRVFYPTARRMRRSLAPEFTLVDRPGIGAVNPRIAHWPLVRAVTDHRLLIFVRN